jgi:hypothetical protein
MADTVIGCECLVVSGQGQLTTHISKLNTQHFSRHQLSAWSGPGTNKILKMS